MFSTETIKKVKSTIPSRKIGRKRKLHVGLKIINSPVRDITLFFKERKHYFFSMKLSKSSNQ